MASFTLDPRSLHRLRDRLHQLEASDAPALLHDAGYASGELLAGRWLTRLNETGDLEDPGSLDTRWFGPLLSEITESLGWGTLSVESLGDRALLVESHDWAEAEGPPAKQPTCQFTTGALAAFLTSQAGAPIAALEVECRAAGSEACRFVAGSDEMISLVWDLMSAGRPWQDAFPRPMPD
jgi:predicted hydrocarbon binding protein